MHAYLVDLSEDSVRSISLLVVSVDDHDCTEYRLGWEFRFSCSISINQTRMANARTRAGSVVWLCYTADSYPSHISPRFVTDSIRYGILNTTGRSWRRSSVIGHDP